LTYELDLDKIRVNHPARYLRQRSFHSKAIVWTNSHPPTHTHTHTPTARHDYKVVGKYSNVCHRLLGTEIALSHFC